jgi:hypothetical protein
MIQIMIVVEGKTANVNVTGIDFLVYATRYQQAAEAVTSSEGSKVGIDIVPYQLLAQSLELLLKSYIWFIDDVGTNKLRSKYGHNIVKLWKHSKEKGLLNHIQTIDDRESVISLIGKYYKDKQLCYLDSEMAFEGYNSLSQAPESLNILFELNKELIVSLKPLLFEASRRGN